MIFGGVEILRKKKKQKSGINFRPEVSIKEPYNYMFLPVLLASIFVTIMIRANVIHADKYTLSYLGSEVFLDFQSRSKLYMMIIFAVIMFIFAFFSIKTFISKKSPFLTAIMISMGTFIIFTLLSACFSKYKAVAFIGYFCQNEGFIAFLCYTIFFVYTVYAYRSSRDFKNVLIAVFIVALFNAFIGAFQLAGHSLITTGFGRSVIFGDLINKLGLSDDYIRSVDLYSGTISGSFINPNYVGSFCALVIPVFTVASFKTQKRSLRILYIVADALSIFLLYGSHSRAGFVGVIATAIVGIIVFIKAFIKKWKISLSVVAVVALAFGLFIGFSDSDMAKKIVSLKTDVVSVFNDTSDYNYLDYVPVQNIENIDGNVIFTLKDGKFILSCKNDILSVTDNDSKIVTYNQTDNVYKSEQKGYEKVTFTVIKRTDDSTDYDCILCSLNGFMCTLRMYENDTLHLSNALGTSEMDAVFAKSIGFKGKEKLGSTRGYIWSRTLPLVKDNIILGGGPDTFLFSFPQNDIFAQYALHGSSKVYYSKPHNVFLQLLINNGGIAFVGFLSLIIIYIVSSVKLYFCKKKYTEDMFIGASVFIGIIGFLVAGMFNDFMVSTAPLFFIFLGLGVAVNYKCNADKNIQQKI